MSTDEIRKKIGKERSLNVDNIEYHDGIYWLCVRGGVGGVILRKYPLAEYRNAK